MTNVREATTQDYAALVALYAHLKPGAPPPNAADPALEEAWRAMLADTRQHVLLVEAKGVLAASCALVIVPNLSHGGRPYGLVENVVTHPDYRRQGFALAALHRAKELAIIENCYKLMLQTGGHHPGALSLYIKAGYNSKDKTAFIQWLN